jgi:hypothetical protein
MCSSLQMKSMTKIVTFRGASASSEEDCVSGFYVRFAPALRPHCGLTLNDLFGTGRRYSRESARQNSNTLERSKSPLSFK